MTGPEGYEDGRQIGARPYLERVGGDMVGPITFQVSGATSPHLAGGTGFGPLVLGKAGTAVSETADTDVLVGDGLEVIGGVLARSGVRLGQDAGLSFWKTSSLYAFAILPSTSFLQVLFATGSVGGRQLLMTDWPNRLLDHGIAAQTDPLFAVFDRENPVTVPDHYLYLQRNRAGAAPTTYYSLLASALGPTLIGDPTFSVAADPVYTNAVAMAGAFNAAALQTLSLGVSSAVGEDLKLRAGTGLPVGGGPVAALEAGGKRVRFGVFVDDDTVVHDGYIIIKDDAGTERWLGVVKAGD